MQRYNFSNILENVKISIFPFTLSRQKCYISRGYLTNFQKLFFPWKEEEGGYCALRISSAQTFSFSNSNVTTFPTSENVKISIFPLHCPGRNAISPEVFNEFSKTFFHLKEEEGGYCGWKFQVHRHFGFAIATLQLFQHPENVKISIFPFTLFRQKCYISRGIWRIFKNFFLAERRETWLLLLTISTAQTYSFCYSNVTTFRTSWKCKNFIFCL